MISLADRTAVVTGASRGIGRAIAVAFATAGADVALVARDEAKLGEVAAEISELGRTAVVLPCNVTDADAVQRTVSAAIDALEQVDVLVNNAGGNHFSVPFTEMRFSGWDEVVRLNLDSTVHFCQALGPHMLSRRTGSVLNVASVAAISAVPTMAHYGAAKAAVLSLTKTLAVEWAHAGVRVNALVPGWIATDLTQFARGSEGVEQTLIGRVPMRRWGMPEEVSGPALFLASDLSSFVTGQALVADGGLTTS
jgi:NAD(P)-dependent dehydrogenase (short-subunit alcohol dehydrogenase family)